MITNGVLGVLPNRLFVIWINNYTKAEVHMLTNIVIERSTIKLSTNADRVHASHHL